VNSPLSDAFGHRLPSPPSSDISALREEIFGVEREKVVAVLKPVGCELEFKPLSLSFSRVGAVILFQGAFNIDRNRRREPGVLLGYVLRRVFDI